MAMRMTSEARRLGYDVRYIRAGLKTHYVLKNDHVEFHLSVYSNRGYVKAFMRHIKGRFFWPDQFYPIDEEEESKSIIDGLGIRMLTPEIMNKILELNK